MVVQIVPNIEPNIGSTSRRNSNYRTNNSSFLQDNPKAHRPNYFDLPEAKTYYPNEIEFRDPLAFIRSIRQEAEKHGICKIVPPKDWKPQFSIDINVTANKLWADIGRSMDYDRKSCTSLSNSLKMAYLKIVKPYEDYILDSNSLSSSRNDSFNNTVDLDQSDKYTDPSIINNTHSSPNSKRPIFYPDKQDNLNKRRKSDSYSQDTIVENQDLSSSPNKYQEDSTITADSDEYYLKYGFEDGKTYSLPEFKKRNDSLKSRIFSSYFNNVNSQSNKVPSEVVERTFWKLVSSFNNDLEVEYGADIPTSVYGSGFPTIEKQPLNKYSSDSWNLTNIPFSRHSLFNYLKENINGMTDPWLYVGMCLSAFCWHNEDNYSYSINYMHWGDTKTWYSVPASQCSDFERVMKNSMPELFDNDPGLLFNLVTMLSPKILVDNNIPVFTIDQNPGEFIITFPQAYHSGFNQGLNFNEAVNFITSDWIEFGEASIIHYQKYKKVPAFSHEELVCNINKSFLDSNTMRPKWLVNAISRLVNNEISGRNSFKTFSKTLEVKNIIFSQYTIPENAQIYGSIFEENLEFLEFSNIPVNCSNCQRFCYFSCLSLVLKLDKSKKFFCLNCFVNNKNDNSFDFNDLSEVKLVLRFSDSDLFILPRNSDERPWEWLNSMWKVIELSKFPTIDLLYNDKNFTKSPVRPGYSNNLPVVLIEIPPSLKESKKNSQINLSVYRSILNYSKYYLQSDLIPKVFSNHLNDLKKFVQKSNYLCAIVQFFLKSSNRNESLKRITKCNILLAKAVFDPPVLALLDSNPPLSKDDNSSFELKLIPQSVKEIFRKLRDHCNSEVCLPIASFDGVSPLDGLDLETVNFYEMSDKYLDAEPPLYKSFENSLSPIENEILLKSYHTLPSLTDKAPEDDVITIADIKSSSAALSTPHNNLRVKRITNTYNKDVSPYVFKRSINRAEKNSPTLGSRTDHMNKPENVYNYCLGVTKGEMTKSIDSFFKKVWSIRNADEEDEDDDDMITSPFSIEHLESILPEFEYLNISCPELDELVKWHKEAMSINHLAKVYLYSLYKKRLVDLYIGDFGLFKLKSGLNKREIDPDNEDNIFSMQDIDLLISRGSVLNLKLEFIDILKLARDSIAWYFEVTHDFSHRTLTLDRMIEFLKQALQLNLPPDQPEFARLLKLKGDIMKWDQEVSSMLGLNKSPQSEKIPLTLRTCATLLERGNNMEFHPFLYFELKAIHSNMLDLQSRVDSVVDRAQLPHFLKRPGLLEAQELYAQIEKIDGSKNYTFAPSSAAKLRDFILESENWLFQISNSFAKPNVQRPVADILLNLSRRTSRGLKVLDKIYSILNDNSEFKTESSGAISPDLLSKLDFAILSIVKNEDDFKIDIKHRNNTGTHDNNILDETCICQLGEVGATLRCSSCPLVYHTKCLKLSKKTLENMENLVCMACNPEFRIFRFTKCPSISSLTNLIESGRKLNLYNQELEHLLNIILDVRNIVNKIMGIIKSIESISEYCDNISPNHDKVIDIQNSQIFKSIYRVCLLVFLGIEIDISNESFNALECNGSFFEPFLRKSINDGSLGNPSSYIPTATNKAKRKPRLSRAKVFDDIIQNQFLNLENQETFVNRAEVLNFGESNFNNENIDFPLNVIDQENLESHNINNSLEVYGSNDQRSFMLINNLNQQDLSLAEENSLIGDSNYHADNLVTHENADVDVDYDYGLDKNPLLTTKDLLERGYLGQDIKDIEFCICLSNPLTDPRWNSNNSLVLKCDFCREYFHLECGYISYNQAITISNNQTIREMCGAQDDVNSEMCSPDILQAYMCPICSYNNNIPYSFGDVELDLS
ncbi:Lysine-specific demethylase lid [Smittium mucronatum]|uniref:Lysine-specific demethylase lid n=1 Tax=Smittium mucronatum TaxID=133383 RepID=A0A1R0H6D3_9FUNG|nr:Lysine-specific demethylase lid [Smittium mucronatum]